MVLFEKIKEGLLSAFNSFRESPGACVFLTCIFALAAILCLRSLISALLEMHRGRSKLKKLRKGYNAWQKIIMKPAWQNCLHAKSFCRVLIVVHHIRVVLFLITLILIGISGILSTLFSFVASLSGAIFLLLDVPILLMHLAMDRYPLQRLKNEYRFKKYHNSKDHESLF